MSLNYKNPAEQPMLGRRLLRLALVSALEVYSDKHGKNWRVESPGVRNLADDSLPAIRVRTPSGRKSSWGPQQPSFTSTITLVVELMAREDSEEKAQDFIEDMEYHVERAIFQNFATLVAIQQFTDTESVTEINATGSQFVAATTVTLNAQLPEVFPYEEPDESEWPVPNPPMDEIDTVVIEADMKAPFDPNGTYPAGDFPDSVKPAPRTEGPDGRVEIGVEITLQDPPA